MKKRVIIIIGWIGITTLMYGQVSNKEKAEVRALIERTAANAQLPNLKLESIPKKNGCDVFEQEVKKNALTIRGSSGVALSRGFYDFLRQNEYGLVSWSGSRIDIPTSLSESRTRTITTPFEHHYYFNVVTYGYSMPYWDWARWEQEIDWMALHGIDMPLALVANEAISARVWKKLGLTDQEIAHYFVGPAHLPWMRMGNISGIDGPMPAEWHNDQVALQHQILKRMRGLGMKPICPGFAGFVPQSMKRIYPEVNIVETSWGGAFHNWMLSPDEDLFHTIGKMFIEEWEKEFGANNYYIVDSFNEMEIPFPPKGDPKRYALLNAYGDAVYRSIKAGNKDAVWVMQGWMFGYQRNIWDYESLEALVAKVPDDKMLLLDLAVDYNKYFWNGEVNWEFYKGFYNKPWVYSVIPNMGGKSGMTGNLSFYANGIQEALHSPYKGRLTGYGMAPEGIENNEVIYELITDAGWNNGEINLDQWLANYSQSRYGIYTDELKSFWNEMQQSVYGSFTDHPRYNWQLRPGLAARGTINVNDHFYKGIEQLCGMADAIKTNPLLKLDFQEWTVAYLGGKMEMLTQKIEEQYLYGDLTQAIALEKQFETLMVGADQLLNKHPNKDMQRWIDFARKHGSTKQTADYYEQNARRIVTIWGPPVDDYSARIWSGLLRDYYLPRWKFYFEQKKSGQRFDFATWERNWVENSIGLSHPLPLQNTVDRAIQLIELAKPLTPASSEKGEMIGNWSSAEVAETATEIQWNLPIEKLKKAVGVKFTQLKGEQPVIVSSVILVMDGQRIVIDNKEKHIQSTAAYKIEIPQNATGNNACLLQIQIKRSKQAESLGKVELLF